MIKNRTRVLIAALVLIGLVITTTMVRSARARFNATSWRASPATGPGSSRIRQRMAADVVRRFLSEGMSRDSVLSLLGPADNTVYFREAGLVYYLGPERNLISGVDSEWLVIYLTSDNRVVRAEVTTD